jgi:renalase
MKKPSIAVIGAGLAGIGAARVLFDAGLRVVVFEKSRGLGGRCATKRWEGQTIDHGAQYFTIRDPAFRAALMSCCGPELLEMAAPIIDENGRPLPPAPRYFHAQGNSRIARALAEGLEIRTGVELQPVVDRKIGDEIFDQIITTAPLPQTYRLARLPQSSTPYDPCLTLLLLYHGEWLGVTREHYAVSDHSGHPLAWTACENHKPDRILPGFTALVVQSSLEFSQEHLEEEPVVWASKLRSLAEDRWKIPAACFHAMHPHRWRFARKSDASFQIPTLPPGWHFTGDLLTDSRIESAWMAGRQTGQKLLRDLELAID